MPLPFKLDHINLWLLEDDGGVAVVDTGIGLDDSRTLWQRLFDGELSGTRVTRVIVTHFHPDHMGNAHWISERFGVDVWCAQAEWLVAQLAWRAGDMDRRQLHFRRNGVADEALAELRRRGNPYPRLVPSVAPHFRSLHEGETLSIGGREWRVLTVHGHSPEQAVLHARDGGVLISGDQILPRITTNVSVWPDQPMGNPLRLYLESLDRFQPMAPDTLVLPSHGLPFHGLPARLDQLRRHHEERLTRAVEALGEPKTGAELIPVLFARELDSHQLNFAIGETLAHLHYLEWQGRVTRLLGEDGLYRFRRS
jgi:glyoxylase-like metal-dependent hydrolase (beta-lactamase superfamily II)